MDLVGLKHFEKYGVVFHMSILDISQQIKFHEAIDKINHFSKSERTWVLGVR